MHPKFNLAKQDRVYITDEYFTNGEFLITRSSMNSPLAPKALKVLANFLPGTYGEGTGKPITSEKTPDCGSVIPKRDGYKTMAIAPIGVKFMLEMDTIQAYQFECPGFVICVSPAYVPILRLGVPFAKDKASPIIILSEGNLNSDLIGLVMPMRF